MAKPGRNEPCPCGSGKKYKKCCGKGDNVIQFPSIDMLKVEIEEVKDLFYKYITNNEELVNEKIRQAASSLGIHENYSNSWRTFFFGWFAFDYHYENNKTIFTVFLQEYQKGIKERVIKILKEWPKSYFSVYEEKERLGNDRVLLKDCFTGEVKEVIDPVLEEEILPGELYLLRLVPVSKFYQCFHGAIVIPAEISRMLLKAIKESREFLEKKGVSYSGWEAFLKEAGAFLMKTIADLFEFYSSEETEKDNLDDDFYVEIKLRRFLQQPQKVLDHKSPMEACFLPNMKGKLNKFLKQVEEGKYDSELGDVPPSLYIDFIESLLRGSVKECQSFINANFENQKYKEEALLLLENIKGHVFPMDMDEAIALWYDYSSRMDPILKKKGTWAAAVEYILYQFKLYDNYCTQKDIAEKYGVSASTVSRNSQLLDDFIFSLEEEEDTPEFVFSSPGTGDKRISESVLFRVKELLEDKNFESYEEANRFLKEIMEKGLPEPSLTAKSKEREAQELIYEAWETDQKSEKIKLAKKALEIDPNNADAYVLLAEYEGKTDEEKICLYRKGVEAGRKSLGEDFFPKNTGYFWGITKTRPFMRAKMGLAIKLLETGQKKEAIEHFLEMLKLNPNDNQGVRYVLVPLLLEEQKLKQAKEILERYSGEATSYWAYYQALYFYIVEGDNTIANSWLQKAIKKNKLVPQYLLEFSPLPPQLPEYSKPGSKEEAVVCAYYSIQAWKRTKGALDWLRKNI